MTIHGHFQKILLMWEKTIKNSNHSIVKKLDTAAWITEFFHLANGNVRHPADDTPYGQQPTEVNNLIAGKRLIFGTV